jgi:hypothetical protein
MQVTTFRVDNPEYLAVGDPVFQQSEAVFHLPQLPAYAMHHSQLTLDNGLFPEASQSQQPEYRLTANSLILDPSSMPVWGGPRGWLTIYHNGIKDHQLLFPHVENSKLKSRLGQFAQEADNAFASQSWLSYVLMVGGVLEGLLYYAYKLRYFGEMINTALENNLISEQEAGQINEVRLARNQIHADKYNRSIPNRSLALEISVIYERLLKRDWKNTTHNEKGITELC